MRTLFAIALLATSLSAFGLDETELKLKAEEVERLRGLSFMSPVEHRVLPRAELRGFLEKQIETQLPGTLESYFAALAALRLVESDVSLTALLDLYDAQVLAFYDPLEHVYYSLDEPPDGIAMPAVMAEAVVVHELVHALQDQRFDVGESSVELQSNWDAAMAFQAVLEGEALLVMMGWLGEASGMTLEDVVAQDGLLAAIQESTSAGTNVPEDVPAYFVESLQFPYVEGLVFVVDIFRNGGWAAIDAMYDDPPLSTEELIQPEIYRQRVQSDMKTEAPLFAEQSDRLVETVLGEFHWSFMLGDEAGRGWASDKVSVSLGTEGATVLVDSMWDDESEAAEFEAAYQSFLEKSAAKNVVVLRQGNSVKAGYGFDLDSIKAFTTELLTKSGSQRIRSE